MTKLCLKKYFVFGIYTIVFGHDIQSHELPILSQYVISYSSSECIRSLLGVSFPQDFKDGSFRTTFFGVFFFQRVPYQSNDAFIVFLRNFRIQLHFWILIHPNNVQLPLRYVILILGNSAFQYISVSVQFFKFGPAQPYCSIYFSGPIFFA